MQVTPGSTAAALVLCLVLAAPAGAGDTAAPELKADIEQLLDKLEMLSQGLLKWDGADRLDIRQDGTATVAEIANARISIASPGAPPGATRSRVAFDRIEVRHEPGPEGATKLAVGFPRESRMQTADGDEIKLTLKDAVGDAVIDAKSGHAREIGLAFAGARLDDKAGGDWIASGPLSLSYKLVGSANGGWTAPIDFELTQIEFLAAKVPMGGAIDRIVYHGRSEGPDLAALDRLRDRVEALRNQKDSPQARFDALLELLPSIPSLFSLTQGELTVEKVAVHPPTGQPLLALAKASIGGALTGLSGDAAALRITLRHDGLTLAPSILEAARVPQRGVLDFGLEEIGTAALRSIVEAAKGLREGASDADKQRATQQMIGVAATLSPVFRIYDLALDTPDVAIAATAETKGSPLSVKGYSAQGDVAVRGFDALPALVGAAPLISYLPLLKEIGVTATAIDGTPRIKFHLASAPPKWITVNGSDVGAWFAGEGAAGQPRALRPEASAMTGADVRTVQKALAAAKIAAPQNGTYDAATAVAVARFQKRNALNVDGVVDAATRDKLGVKPEPALVRPGSSPPGRRE